MFTQCSTKISLYQTRLDKILKFSETDTIFIIFNLSKDKTVQLDLNNCVYTLDLNYNLISTSQLIKKSVNTILQTINKASELVYKAEVLNYADLVNNQYILRVKDENIVLVTKLKSLVKL